MDIYHLLPSVKEISRQLALRKTAGPPSAMSFVAPTTVRVPNPRRCLTTDTTARWRVSVATARRQPLRCAAAGPSTTPAATVAPEKSVEPASSPFACISCKDELPASLDQGRCSNCGTIYSNRGSYVDFVSSEPTDALSQVRRLVTAPLTQALFETGPVAYLYERGWRRNFERVGFPGPAAEAELAVEHVGRRGTILDVSCATGVFTREVASRGDFDSVVALDYSAAMLEEAARRDENGAFRRVRADVAAMPFRDGAFDSVVSGAAMHCWPKVQDGLAEISRVLKEGGPFFGTTFLKDAFLPAAMLPGGRVLMRPGSSLTFFDREQVFWLCKAAGFSKVEVEVLDKCAVIRCVK